MERYGLIGHPLGHSFSQRFFTEKFQQEGLDCHYSNFDMEEIESFPLLLKKNHDIKGFNVTIPYKEKILSYLDGVDAIVDEIRVTRPLAVSAEDAVHTGVGYMEHDFIDVCHLLWFG